MNAIGYVRISTKDQSNYSLDYQEASIRQYCEKNDLNLLAVFKDDGESSFTFDRPDWLALESFIKKHKGSVQYLIIMDHDRFSRNMAEALIKIEKLEEKHRLKVLASNEPIDLDPKDPSVFLQRAFRYLLANEELLRIRKRTKQGLMQAMEGGRYVSFAPFGLLNGKDERNKSLLVVDKERAPIIQFIFKSYLAGRPIQVIYNQAKKLGFTISGNSAIPRVLGNCLYAGLIKIPATDKTPERYVRALHQPIISESDFWQVQELLGNKSKPKTQPKKDMPLRGILKCPCGRNMTAGFTKGRNSYYLYYRCIKHANINIPGNELHDKFQKIIEDFDYNKEQLEFITKEVNTRLENALGDSKKLIASKKKQLAELETKIERLEERLMNDEIEPETYKKWFRNFSMERSRIINEINGAQATTDDVWNVLKALLPELTRVSTLYKEGDYLQKNLLLKAWFKQGITYENGVFRTGYLNPVFLHNLLKIKEKGLLDFEEPRPIWESVPYGTPDGS